MKGQRSLKHIDYQHLYMKVRFGGYDAVYVMLYDIVLIIQSII